VKPQGNRSNETRETSWESLHGTSENCQQKRYRARRRCLQELVEAFLQPLRLQLQVLDRKVLPEGAACRVAYKVGLATCRMHDETMQRMK
jgi:hypothetical protein